MTALVSTWLLLTGVVPAAAQTEIVPTYRAERVYLHCVDSNVRLHQLAATSDPAIPWNATRPSGDFAGDGAGCFAADPPIAQSTSVGDRSLVLDAVFEGTFTGNLQQLTVHLHDLSQRSGNPAGSSLKDLDVTLEIDGETVLDQVRVRPVGVEQNAGITYLYDFSITNLGLGVEDGEGAQTRSYRLMVESEQPSMWAYDASEIPSGISFNPRFLAPARIER